MCADLPVVTLLSSRDANAATRAMHNWRVGGYKGTCPMGERLFMALSESLFKRVQEFPNSDLLLACVPSSSSAGASSPLEPVAVAAMKAANAALAATGISGRVVTTRAFVRDPNVPVCPARDIPAAMTPTALCNQISARAAAYSVSSDLSPRLRGFSHVVLLGRYVRTGKSAAALIDLLVRSEGR